MNWQRCFIRERLIGMHVEIDKRFSEDVICEKHIFNRYGTILSFISNFLTEVTNTDEMYEIHNNFNNEINELKSEYLVGQDDEADDVIENTSIVITIS